MNIRISCCSKKEAENLIMFISKEYKIISQNIIEENNLSFWDDKCFAEFELGGKREKNKKNIVRKKMCINKKPSVILGNYYMYKGFIVKVIKEDKDDMSNPYKCNIYSDSAKVVNSKWLNSKDIIDINFFSDINIGKDINPSMIKKIKEDWRTYLNTKK